MIEKTCSVTCPNCHAKKAITCTFELGTNFTSKEKCDKCDLEVIIDCFRVEFGRGDNDTYYVKAEYNVINATQTYSYPWRVVKNISAAEYEELHAEYEDELYEV
jgi:hypothetical protein